jgi:hypothetical protein
MSRLARAVEILEAINKFYQEGDDAPLSGSAIILDDDSCISDAIKDCIGVDEQNIFEPVIPHSKRRRWAFHFATGYSGWVGKRKMIRFYTREEAVKWVNEQS